MKIAISGKGGVGKTTLAAMLTAVLSLEGRRVVALDADPDANLAAALGVPPAEYPTPLCEMRALIAERTGSQNGAGGYFTLNPKVDDIPDDYAAKLGENVRLLALGGVPRGGGGCICPATAVVKALLAHLILGRDEDVIMDMEAGIEHLGRATSETMDALVIVVNTNTWSLQTAQRILELAADIGITRVCAIINQVQANSNMARVSEALGDLPIVGRIPQEPSIADGPVRLGDDGGVEAVGWLAGHLDEMRGILARIRDLA